MENLLSTDSVLDIHIDQDNESDGEHLLTLEEIISMLDLPSDELNILPANISINKQDHQLEHIENIEATEQCSVSREEPNMKQENVFETAESVATSTHIVHGVLNININKMLDSQLSINKQIDQNPESINTIINDESPINNFGFSIYSGQDLFQTYMEADEKPAIEEIVKIMNAKSSCSICTKPALKYSSYGGTACSSCRSFFRRSSQNNLHTLYHCKRDKNCMIDPNTRKNCQYCRFHTCLKSGMKITWVLSDDERKRRFGKAKNSDLDTLKSKPGHIMFSSSTRAPLYLSFTIEEQNVLEDTYSKFQIPWLQNFLVDNVESATNLIKFTYGLDDLRKTTWDNLSNSMHLNFIRNVLPKFSELSTLPSSDFGQIINSENSRIQLFFRGCFVVQMNKSEQVPVSKCPIGSQVKYVANNTDLLSSVGLSDLLSNLDLSDDDDDGEDMWIASYEKIYPQNWAGSARKEQKHRNIVERIIAWPKIERNEGDNSLVTLMSLILALNADFYPLKSREIMENIQLKYILILQRYLRSKLAAESANKKFLEAMLLIADTREAWEMVNSRIGDY